MADNINDNNTIVARKRLAPWIGIGAQGAWTDYMDAMRAADLDFHVHSEDLYWDRPDGFSLDECKIGAGLTGYPCHPENVQMYANVRGDTNQVLGLVTPRYEIVQNAEAFKVMQQVTDAGGVITNAGMTEQGLCFMVARMHGKDVNGEEFEINIMATNSFNTAFPIALIITPVRIICQNMYRRLMSNKDNLLVMRHNSHIHERLISYNSAMGRLASYEDDFNAMAVALAAASMSVADYKRLVEMIFPYPKPGGKYEQTSIDKVDALRNMFHDEYYLASDNQRWVGTPYGLVNAYYDYLSHGDNRKNMAGSWEDKRLSRLVDGSAVNNQVIKEAIKIAK